MHGQPRKHCSCNIQSFFYLWVGLRSFIEACRGQSVGGIGKKGKDGVVRMKEATTFREICDSFR